MCPADGGEGRAWSNYQQAIFDAVDAGDRNLVIEALAGTGKSTTIEEAVRWTPEAATVLVCAFNVEIAKAMAPRLREVSGCDVRTTHSLGMRAITAAHGSRKVDKYNDVAKEMLKNASRGWAWKDIGRPALALLGFAKGQLTDWSRDALDKLADARGLQVDPTVREAVLRAVASVMRAQASNRRNPISFDDMIWLPAVQGLKPPELFDWVFVDETQDLNAAQLELVVSASRGRIVAVGDSHQAIYGFRGADSAAMRRIATRVDATIMPLSICYRCASSVLDEARAYVPAIENAPGAPLGEVRTTDTAEMYAEAAAGDFVLSRTNAPLVSAAYKWISRGVRAAIRGRNIGAGLTAFVQGTGATTVADLVTATRQWLAKEAERLQALDRPIDAATDTADCVIALTEGAADVAAVLAKIDALFVDVPVNGSIMLSSTHRAKGLEAKRVWLLRDTYLTKNTQEERNLLYVAITRAREELIYVRKEAE